MKNFAVCSMAVGILGVGWQASAAFSLPFGPLTFNILSPVEFQDVTLDLQPTYDTLRLNSLFSASVTFTPDPANTENVLDSFSINYASVIVRVESSVGTIGGMSGFVDFDLGPLNYSFMLNPGFKTEAGGTQFAPVTVPFPSTLVPRTTPLTPGMAPSDTFTITFYGSPTGPSIGGTKGGTLNTDTQYLEGQIQVPEPTGYALMAGLGLVMMSGLRRSRV